MPLALKTALPERIATARLTLRALVRGDLDQLVALADNANLHRVLARLPHPYTSADGIDFIEIVSRSPTEAIYAIVDTDDALVGVAGLTLKENEAPELGYWLGEPFWGQGYATEALGALLAAAYATGQIETVAARCMSANAASRRVLEKLGFGVTEERIAACGPHKDVPVLFMVHRRERRAA